MIENTIIRATLINVVILFALIGLGTLGFIPGHTMKICLLMIGLMYVTFIYRVLSKENSAEEEGH